MTVKEFQEYLNKFPPENKVIFSIDEEENETSLTPGITQHKTSIVIYPGY